MMIRLACMSRNQELIFFRSSFCSMDHNKSLEVYFKPLTHQF